MSKVTISQKRFLQLVEKAKSAKSSKKDFDRLWDEFKDVEHDRNSLRDIVSRLSSDKTFFDGKSMAEILKDYFTGIISGKIQLGEYTAPILYSQDITIGEDQIHGVDKKLCLVMLPADFPMHQSWITTAYQGKDQGIQDDIPPSVGSAPGNAINPPDDDYEG